VPAPDTADGAGVARCPTSLAEVALVWSALAPLDFVPASIADALAELGATPSGAVSRDDTAAGAGSA